MQLTTIKHNNGIFIQLPDHILANMDNVVSNLDDDTHQIHTSFVPKNEPHICPQVQALSGCLKAHIGTANDEIDDDEKAFLQALLDDDNRIKAEKSC